MSGEGLRSNPFSPFLPGNDLEVPKTVRGQFSEPAYRESLFSRAVAPSPVVERSVGVQDAISDLWGRSGRSNGAPVGVKTLEYLSDSFVADPEGSTDHPVGLAGLSTDANFLISGRYG